MSFVGDKQAAFFETFEATQSLSQILNDLCAGEWSDFEEGRQARYGFDEIMRWYALHGEGLAIKRLYCDEVQDVNPVMLAVIKRQIEAGTQVILVGDSAQKIYGWNGAVNAFERLKSYRFGNPDSQSQLSLWNSVTGLANAIHRKKQGSRCGLEQAPAEPTSMAQNRSDRADQRRRCTTGELASQRHKIWSPRPIDVRLI